MDRESRNLAHFWAYLNAPKSLRQHFYRPSIDTLVNENAGVYRPVEGTREYDKERVTQIVWARMCAGDRARVQYVMREVSASLIFDDAKDSILPVRYALMRRWAKRIERERKRRGTQT